jgi:hypothetical protein
MGPRALGQPTAKGGGNNHGQDTFKITSSSRRDSGCGWDYAPQNIADVGPEIRISSQTTRQTRGFASISITQDHADALDGPDAFSKSAEE